jgi:hypothetical protein
MWKRVCLQEQRMVATDSDAIDVILGSDCRFVDISCLVLWYFVVDLSQPRAKAGCWLERLPLCAGSL